MDDVTISRLLRGAGLGRGAHRSREEGMCAMELVAYIAGEEHGFAPACASKLLSGFTIRLNDSMRRSERESLKPFLPRLIDTNRGDDRQRFEAMARATIMRLLVPALARQGATLLAARLRQRSLASLDGLAFWLRGLDKGDPDTRLRNALSRGIRQSFCNAVGAANRLGDGAPPNWNWCGGELGIAVAEARHLTGDDDWAVVLQILEIGIDACPMGRGGTGSTSDDTSELTRAARYVCI